MNHRQKKRHLLARIPIAPKELLILLWPRRHGKTTYVKSRMTCGLGGPWEVGIIEGFRFLTVPYRDNHLKSNNWCPDMPEVQMEMFL